MIFPVIISFFQMWAFELVKTTMKPLYDDAYGEDPDMEAEFGWKVKKEELWSNHAWYMLARWEENYALSRIETFSKYTFPQD